MGPKKSSKKGDDGDALTRIAIVGADKYVLMSCYVRRVSECVRRQDYGCTEIPWKSLFWAFRCTAESRRARKR